VTETQFGFDWGPVVVERVAHIEGRGYCVSVRGQHDYEGPEIQVYVSEKGRVVRAHLIRGATSVAAKETTTDPTLDRWDPDSSAGTFSGKETTT
jgi:hypothetical protein